MNNKQIKETDYEKNYVKNQLIDYIKNIQKKEETVINKHLCEHLLWLIGNNKTIQEKDKEFNKKLKQLKTDVKKIIESPNLKIVDRKLLFIFIKKKIEELKDSLLGKKKK